MVFETAGTAEAFLLARILFGGVLAFLGVNHFLNAESMTGYAQAKGLPAPGLAVIASGVMLVAGGLGLVTGAFPVLTAGMLLVFLVVTTLTMHDFWAVSEEEKQDEMTAFLKNVAMIGGLLVLFALGGVAWPYAVDVGLF